MNQVDLKLERHSISSGRPRKIRNISCYLGSSGTAVITTKFFSKKRNV